MPVIHEEVRYDIKVELENAISQLKKIADGSQTGAEAVKSLSMFLAKMSKETKIPLEQLRRTMEGINNEIIKTKGRGIFGDFSIGDKGIFDAVKGYNEAAVASGRFATTQGGVVTSVNKASRAMEDADRKARGFGHGIDIIRTALGTLAAVGIFQFLNALQAIFTEFIHNLRETELAIYNLINAEKRLSQAGIEITPKGLQEIIDSVRELVPILSQIDAEELVARIATNVAPSIKLTREEMEKLAKAVALAYVQNKALGYSFDEIEKSFTDSVLTGKVSQGINKYGVKIDDLIIKQHAVSMGLVENEKAFDNLSGEMKSHVQAVALIDYAYQEFGKNAESIGEYMQTADSQIERTKTAWSNLLTTIGQFSGPGLAKGIGLIADALEGWIGIITFLKPVIVDFIATVTAGFQTLGFLIQNPMTGLVEFADKFAEFKNASVAEMMSSLATATDTATQSQEDYNAAVDNFDADEFKQKLEDIKKDMEEAMADLDTNRLRKLADLDEEYRRKAIDAEQDYRRKIEDINRDAERDIARIKENHREQDQRDEERYQLQLWELRMRFLMDLEDALHARDARQVIRLQKQYALDKEALRRKHELEGREREDSQRNELEDIERRRQERLADARIEYEQKLADQRLAKQRELEDLATWYAREQADIEEAQKRKLETLLKGWIDEQKITEANAAEVYGILTKYFGPGGLTDSLYQYMMNSLIASTQGAIAAAMSAIPTTTGMLGGGVGGGGYTHPLNFNSGGSAPVYGHISGGRAEGGTLIATRPTRAVFGEGGAEAVTFTPLTKIGRNEGKVDVSGSLDDLGMNGKIAVDLYLSPDLEARVVENSMNGVAEAIVKINRTKV